MEFLYDLTKRTITRSTMFRKLKNVRVFSIIICLYVLVFGFSLALTFPSAILYCTCSFVSPVIFTSIDGRFHNHAGDLTVIDKTGQMMTITRPVFILYNEL